MMLRVILSVAIMTIFATLTTTAMAQSPSQSTRDLAFDSYNNYFYVSTSGGAYYKTSTGNSARSPHFWHNAEMIEAAEDAYDRSPSSGRAAMVSALCNGFVSQFGTDWSSNKFNDDLLWAAIAFARAKVITGNDTFGQIGASNFNRVWARAWDSALGGGLWWTTDKTTKNACVNGPGAIAATLFYRMNYGSNYLNQATQIYNWERSNLFNSTTGKVDDHKNADGSLNGWAFSYNQGTFAGAAALLYQTVGGSTYYSDGQLAIRWTKNNLTGQHVAGILNDEYSTGDGYNDGAGFKGPFARWAGKWIRVTGNTEFNAWMQQNANAAWTYRNSSGVSWAQWWQRTSDTSVTSWECSSALAMIQNCP